ncbi:L,D-transpeptidase family protein [Sandaracinobacter sp. RS1-74]|uniref:L,D-transpeptidase family protein n=1 Tax=Sandaracinobacteroides sayramensis TaxID=2913411 RepID=UPI001EDC82A3|nr:L,D-transpeptidase family protein [Sandaracinobacteroides sayramensis]MCG2841883.1 L,D-transpeptidase family protein [Sandaracinobacteroides sayramensis]
MMRAFPLLALVAAAPVMAQGAWSEAAARETLAAVQAAAAEGLNPSDYAPEALEAALKAGDPEAIATAAEASWLALAQDYAAGRTPQAARVGWKSPPPRSDPEWLKAKLAAGLEAHAPGAALKALLPTHPHYAALKAALPAAEGEARARLRANLERWRWTPRQMGERYLLANVPAFEVDLWDGGRVIARHRTIVGTPKNATPQFSAVVTAVTINPSWYLPQSIVKESVGGLIQRSPAAARARGYRWTSTESGLQVTQVPGRNNSLGTLKIEMPNPWAIYFHDTPNKQLFTKPVRAFSHGCMRTQGILGLALRLLEDVPGWDAARIDSTAATNETETIPLPQQVPVHVAYFTVAPGPAGSLRTFADIYGRDAPVIAALKPKAVRS